MIRYDTIRYNTIRYDTIGYSLFSESAHCSNGKIIQLSICCFAALINKMPNLFSAALTFQLDTHKHTKTTYERDKVGSPIRAYECSIISIDEDFINSQMLDENRMPSSANGHLIPNVYIR